MLSKVRGAMGKFYAVARGRAPGVYTSWSACEAQTRGFSSASYRSFKTAAEAQAFVDSESSATSGYRSSYHTSSAHAAAPDDDKRDAAASHSASAASSAPPSERRLILRFDGGARGHGYAGSSTAAGCAAVLVDEATGAVAASTYKRLEKGATNNAAEYTGLQLGLRLVEALGAKDRLAGIQGDSELVIKQLRGTYAVKAAGLIDRHADAITQLDKLGLRDRVGALAGHIARADNSLADSLANKAMDACAEGEGVSWRDPAYFSSAAARPAAGGAGAGSSSAGAGAGAGAEDKPLTGVRRGRAEMESAYSSGHDGRSGRGHSGAHKRGRGGRGGYDDE